MANPFEILVTNLNAMGFFGFLLPWLFMFAVSYAVLLKSKAIGEDPKIIGVVSLVVAFFIIGYGGPALGSFFTNLFGMAGIVLAVILVIALFIGMAGGDITALGGSKPIMALIAGVGIIIFMLASGVLSGVSLTDSTISVIFVLLVMGVAVAFIAGK
jgi:hypothetical protein